MTSFLVPFNALKQLLANPAAEMPDRTPPRCDHRCEAPYHAVPCALNCVYAPYHHLLLQLLKRREGAVLAGRE